MKKFLFFCAATIVLASNALAQLEVVQCTEDDYKKGIQSMFYCSCLEFSLPNLSPADSARMDSVLLHYFLAAEGYDDTVHYDLWRHFIVLQLLDTKNFIVKYGPIIKGGDGDVVLERIAFLDASFRPLGFIVGDRATWDCCAHKMATLENSLSGDVYPVLHIYKWDSHSAIPVEVGKYAPKDFVIQEFHYGLHDLYVKGYYIVDELYAGNTGFLKITVK